MKKQNSLFVIYHKDSTQLISKHYGASGVINHSDVKLFESKKSAEKYIAENLNPEDYKIADQVEFKFYIEKKITTQHTSMSNIGWYETVEAIEEVMNIGDIYTTMSNDSQSKSDKELVKEKLEQVLNNVENLREHLLRERFKVEHLVRNIRDDDPDPEEIEFIIPRSLMKKLLFPADVETEEFTEGDWVSGNATTLSKYFKDGKTPGLFKQMDEIIIDNNQNCCYFNDEAGINDYYLDCYEIRRKKVNGGWCKGCIVFEIKLKFVKEEMVECCITEEEVPKRDAYYNGDVYMSADAYEEFTRCQ